MPLRSSLFTLLCLLVFAHGAARASTRAGKELRKELKRAEAVLSKLRRLEEASASSVPGGFVKAARKLYPGLYANAARLREGDLKTDLSTAVALYESALRAGADAAAPDCSRELRETYARLCRETIGGGRAGLMRAKALLHARRAEAALRYARGERDAATLEAVSIIRAERVTDSALAEEALLVLEELISEAGGAAWAAEASAHRAAATGRSAQPSREVLNRRPSGEAADTQLSNEATDRRPSGEIAGRLEQVERVLASMPRDRARQLLREARDAFRDALYWRLTARPARALVVDANSFAAHGTLPRLGLRADDADRAALANLRAALKLIRKAKEESGTR